MRRLSPHRKHTEELNLEEKSQGGFEGGRQCFREELKILASDHLSQHD